MFCIFVETKNYIMKTKKLLNTVRNISKNYPSIEFTEILVDNMCMQMVLNPNQFDVIVSNPPYVRQLEKAEINTNVLAFEPHLALFVSDENPLIFYRKIAELAQKNLKPNGLLFFEINQYLGKETVCLLADLGFATIELKKDIYGNDRMIKASVD